METLLFKQVPHFRCRASVPRFLLLTSYFLIFLLRSNRFSLPAFAARETSNAPLARTLAREKFRSSDFRRDQFPHGRRALDYTSAMTSERNLIVVLIHRFGLRGLCHQPLKFLPVFRFNIAPTFRGK